MTYDLSRLGSNRFEHMVQALALAKLGPGIQIFGAGPDGGREATFRGEIAMEGKGYVERLRVIQAKYKERLGETAADQKWFFEQITAELNDWIDPKKKRHHNKPDYLILVTNVALTGVSQTGGLDRLDRMFSQYREMGEKQSDGTLRKTGMPDFRDYHVWHAEYLDRLLEAHAEIRRCYADLVLPGDILTRLLGQVEEDDARIAHAWIGHVAGAMKSDTTVELGESGDNTNSKLSLAEVAVDLPASSVAGSRKTSPVLKALVERGDQVLSPAHRPAAKDRMVVLGGPGSGKSTISRLLCQLYRVPLLENSASGRITAQTAERANRIRISFEAAGLPDPTLHRLPVRVVLSKFADLVSRDTDLTLLQHIVSLINHRASDPITVVQAKRLLNAWPVLVVLDGMDEVASAVIREEVSARIADFLNEMAALRADVFTVCTSRPIGFDRDPDIDYEELHLASLTTTDAMHYASRLLACRFADNLDRQEQVVERLTTASRSEDTARLMTSPLQVTILSLLLEQRRQAPASRYALFKNYYDIIYARECDKPEGIGDVLEMYRSQFDQLHEQCGLAIHARAERGGAAESILPVDELENIARGILEAEGHQESQQETLIEKILHLARQRLVLLVARGDGLAFEVRSLTEFFAARCLMAKEDAADKLELMVPSAHWRHTWLLAAGYIFSERHWLRDTVLNRLNTVDNRDAVNRLVMPGAVLAIDALQDGFAANAPRFEQDLAQAAMKLLKGPIGSHITWLADALAPFMDRSDNIARSVWREVEALLADQSPGATRAFLTGLGTTEFEAIAARATNRLVEYSERNSTASTDDAPTDLSAIATLRGQLLEMGFTDLSPAISIRADLDFFDAVVRQSIDDGPADVAVVKARELIIEGVRNNYRHRSRIRARLAEAIAHDYIGHHLI